MSIFKPVFSTGWKTLPSVLLKHYANRPKTKDVVTMTGSMNVQTSKIFRIICPFISLVGVSLPPQGSNISTVVYGRSELESNQYIMDRQFHHPNKKTYYFKSALQPIGENNVLEILKYGISWHAQYITQNNSILLKHKGYVWRVGNFNIPLPLTYILGECSAEETAIDEETFSMKMGITHFLFGDIYIYSGIFKITDVFVSPPRLPSCVQSYKMY